MVLRRQGSTSIPQQSLWRLGYTSASPSTEWNHLFYQIFLHFNCIISDVTCHYEASLYTHFMKDFLDFYMLRRLNTVRRITSNYSKESATAPSPGKVQGCSQLTHISMSSAGESSFTEKTFLCRHIFVFITQYIFFDVHTHAHWY